MNIITVINAKGGCGKRVIETLDLHNIPRARSEIRTCGWLAQVDENGGSIFQYRPYSKGAADMRALVAEVLDLLGRQDATASSADALTTITNQQHEAA